MTETDNPIDRQTMIYKVSWQTGFLLQAVRRVSSQSDLICGQVLVVKT